MTSRVLILAAGLAGAVALAAGPAAAQKKGGNLVFAQEATIPTLDMHMSTAIATRNVAMHIYETLITRDDSNAPVLELAEDLKVSDDGLVYTFKLRQGVSFHNGKEMTSADVKASIDRYRRMALRKRYLAQVVDVAASGKYEVTVTLGGPQPCSSTISASPKCWSRSFPKRTATRMPARPASSALALTSWRRTCRIATSS